MPKGAGLAKDFHVFLAYTGPGGQKLAEYNPTSLPETGAACARTDVWAECKTEAGKTFKIVVKDVLRKRRRGSKAIQAKLLIDGRLIDTFAFCLSQRTWTINTITLKRDGKVASYPLTFAGVNTVQDHSDATILKKDVAAVGTIIIQLTYVTMWRNIDESEDEEEEEDDKKGDAIEELGSLWEEDAKIGMMITGCREADSSRPYYGKPKMPYAWVGKEGDATTPFYEFCVRYATLPILEKKLGLGAPVTVIAPMKRSRSTSSDSSFFEILDIPNNAADAPSPETVDIKPAIIVDAENDVSSDDEDEKELIRAFLEVHKTKKREEKKARVGTGRTNVADTLLGQISLQSKIKVEGMPGSGFMPEGTTIVASMDEDIDRLQYARPDIDGGVSEKAVKTEMLVD